MSALQRLKAAFVRFESRWFDLRRGVKTSGETELFPRVESPHFHEYLPTRPKQGLRLLRSLPIDNYADFTFVDYGSGKGRMLLLAAQFPFQAIYGIENDPVLHQQALSNLTALNRRSGVRRAIYGLHLDARDFELPDGDLVLYFFNPFAEVILRGVLGRITDALIACPRRLFLITLYMDDLDVAAFLPQLKLLRSEHRAQIYCNC